MGFPLWNYDEVLLTVEQEARVAVPWDRYEAWPMEQIGWSEGKEEMVNTWKRTCRLWQKD